MARLPTPGGDNDNWGSILNEFLGVSHNTDGTPKENYTVINVTDYGATGNGSTDDAAAIQSAINASSFGDVIFFPRGTYIVGTTISLLKGRRYIGQTRETSVIRQKNNSNLDAVLASETWLSSSSTVSDNPISIEHIGINGNKSNQTSGAGHGIVLVTFWNTLNNITIYNTRGEGIRLSSARRDGVEVTNSAVECHLYRIDVRGPDSHGIRIHDPTASNQTVTDGWITDCIVQSGKEDGIRVDSSAGWSVIGCHVYGVEKNGIHMGRADSTRVLSNYIETWGDSTTVGTYSAIALGDGSSTFIGSPNPSIVCGNTAFFTGGEAGGSSIRGIRIYTSNSITGQISVTGNAIHGNGFHVGISVNNQGSAGITNVAFSGNLITNWLTRISFGGTGTINTNGDMFKAVDTSATSGFLYLPNTAGIPTGTPASTAEGIPAVVDSTNNSLYVYTNSLWNQIGSGTKLGGHNSPSRIETFPRFFANTSVVITSGVLYLAYVTPDFHTLVSRLSITTRTTASSGLTFARLGLYTVDSSGNITLVARTANDTTLGNSTNTIYERSFDTTGGYPANYTMLSTSRYAIGLLMVGTTMPLIVVNSTQGLSTLLNMSPSMSRTLSSQSDLPTSVASGSLSDNYFLPFFYADTT